MSSMNAYGEGKEKDVEYVRCEEIREVERNDGTATETREMLDIGPENASKLSCMLVEPSSMTKNSAPKPQKKSTFCGEHHLEEEKCSLNLMDQMIAEARDAKASKYKEDQERRNHFGKGLETGFLNTQTGAAYKARRQVKCGNVKNIEVIEAPKSKANSLALNEVQEAMRPTGISAAEQMLANGDWADESFRKRIMAQPKLSAAMATPEFGRVLKLMKEDPKKLKEVLEKNPNIAELYKELMMLLHEHFQELGEKEERTAAKELGPLAEKAILKHQVKEKTKKKVKEAASPPSQGTIEELDNKAKNILAKPDLRALLEDKELQRVLFECGNPAALRLHMNNPTTRAKIMQLKDAGLISIQ